mmetsp:Transcript_27710/g.76256  ORF Transcript_27710/g.76256 Transcript_27710/m.76256 type:complete len:98 (+) Transcript_27710:77-370(+)|eukprot:CAMPEP_0168741542 /NCGR_PEP_ID=MMETSP0724-20121128/12571_1 /TAXON_ID=265536 /ORGANISM="Amphiprora sp., Strain CCMP467" /LENGTH=97 /DNA_ID=CAMNT_0008789057 /DNA_START=44 /DNA_END=337 /DNA_ORIENTATION=-
MSAFFDFSSLITVLLLLICTTYYIRELRPTIFDHSPLDAATAPQQQQQAQGQPTAAAALKRDGINGFLWKLSRIGERLSPYVGAGCAVMALHVLLFK